MEKLLDNASPPFMEAMVNPGTGLLTDSWRSYLGRLPATLDSICNRISVVALAGQQTSLSPTDFSGAPLLPGLYRVTYQAHVTQNSSGTSSLIVTVGWTDGGNACAFSGNPIVGNTTSTVQSETSLIRIDKGSAVAYQTTYVSTGGRPMLYSLDLVLEKVKV